MKMRFIGDIHANFNKYINLTNSCESSIQVGDFGIGFEDTDNPIPYLSTKHTFIRGNHDFPEGCRNHPNWIPNGKIINYPIGDKNVGVMFIGGALSVDKHKRIQGKDWWIDEELTYGQWNEIYDHYVENKPNVMVTHAAPNCIFPYPENIIPSITGNGLTSLWESEHKPKLWIFGHYHHNIDRVINGCRFICIDCCDHVDIDFTQYV